MKQELAWGTAAAMAIVAAVGISSQPGNKSNTSGTDRAGAQTVARGKAPRKGAPESGVLPQCADSIPLLQNFFLHEKITGPFLCYEGKVVPTPLDPRYQTSFLIATLPDPVHTHFSLLFDRLVEAIQEGAQDERYEYDSSWLPWETEESTFEHLKDQDEADERKDKRENQPGIILFRRSVDSPQESPYEKALVVLVVGEEPTRGIHRAQFENAIAWIDALQSTPNKRMSVAILGPSFSGSFDSLAALLKKDDDLNSLNNGQGFFVFSGGASSRKDAERFADRKKVTFRSFVQDDTTALDRLCRYFDPKSQHLTNLAIVSEDETAYGSIVAQGNLQLGQAKDKPRLVCDGAINIYYPRDISSLRAAYQTQSMFGAGAQTGQETAVRKSLPTDLADPTRQQHDTVSTYAGNQIPLSQEAQLLGIVDVLRSHHAEYVLLRSSNTLDPLFLANFLRRDYPEARIVVLNSDLLFQRGQDAMALTGVMTVSTYPLFSWSREWSALAAHDAHSHRIFPENSTEGIYIASRMLLQQLARDNSETPYLNCTFADTQQIFVPAMSCSISSPTYAPLPDYGPPFWMKDDACESDAAKCNPSTWLSVITRNGTWPLAVLNEHTMDVHAKSRILRDTDSGEDRGWTALPRSTRLILVMIFGLALFHLLCCHFASFTAKPAFRAHFATGDRKHTWLVLIGSCVILLMALYVGWGAGGFTSQTPPESKWPVRTVVMLVWLLCGAAIVANIKATKALSGTAIDAASFKERIRVSIAAFAVFTAAFFICWVWPIEGIMVLGSRAFVYWRAMHLTSGVSPVVPYLFLSLGIYLWFWYALHGMALFGPDRPCLPPLKTLGVNGSVATKGNHGSSKLKLSMFSQETVADPAERIAKPLARDSIVFFVLMLGVVAALLFGFGRGVPVRNLGAMRANRYTLVFCMFIVFYASLIPTEALQVWRTWSCARQLLVFLDRLPLRRTLSALHGFSWGSVWKMSGNVLDVRYKLLSRQLECLTHIHNSLRHHEVPLDPEAQTAHAGLEKCAASVTSCRQEGACFAKWYADHYNDPKAADLGAFHDFQQHIAETTGIVLTELLLPATRVEEHSLIQINPEDERDEKRLSPPTSDSELIRNAEELVCLTYLGYAQNLLGRIRTIVLGGVYLFLALSIAVSSYPFDPRTLLSGILLLLFIAFGGVVIFAYADMHRDATLSHVTNTTPGELGSEFWLKIIGYGAAPVLALITQAFPEWSGFLFSWLQPGLSSLK